MLSLPGRCCMWTSARRASQVWRGSDTINFAPRRNARFISNPKIGCASVGFAPMRNNTLQSLISAVLLVIAPLPKLSANPATVCAWQLVAQLSTLLVPTAARAIFCPREFSSLVQRADEMTASESGPCFSRVSRTRRPTSSSASDQLALRKAFADQRCVSRSGERQIRVEMAFHAEVAGVDWRIRVGRHAHDAVLALVD